MLLQILTKIFGNKNDRELKKLSPIVSSINALEDEIKSKSDEELKEETFSFKEQLKNGSTLEDILPRAFAVVREASMRVLKMRHFDVQLIGGIVLHNGNIAEMKTGEGKTLVATLPAYLNALTGKGVHVITVNDYLAKRDADWMGKLYAFLGLTTGVIVNSLNDEERKEAYNADITYGTNNEFGFDYLRDNMKFEKEHFVQRENNFAIVDEVDSILIDEARTPLIISGPAEKSTNLYVKADAIAKSLKKESDYVIDEKANSAVLTEEGALKAEELFGLEKSLYDHENIEYLHHINQSIKAYGLFKKDVDYIVKDGEVVIVDEFTGRLMAGRRYSEGLHQALEAKENVKIANENQTLASITFQNFFRMYDKLSGMTGTAETEALEFKKIYNLDVMVIPTHQEMIRIDHPDIIYKTKKEKYKAVINEIVRLNKKEQPVLVGTISIDVSEELSLELKKIGIKHNVLNAKNHSKEAEIVANAGQIGGVTIATNMAGRGTDIVLGKGVKELGGLYILGTERHESRRIDNQLRGRSGRQGDEGESRFFLALDDDLLRIFGGERITGIMDKIGMKEDEPITHNLISRVIENAQRRVEGQHFDIRKHLLKYDDVMNEQRKIVYEQRKEALYGENLKLSIETMAQDIIGDIVEPYLDKNSGIEFETVQKQIFDIFDVEIEEKQDGMEEFVFKVVQEKYDERENLLGAENFRQIEKTILLEVVDNLWKNHLLNMDHLKEGIGLRGYAQQDPLIVYKKEAFEMFQEMINRIKEETLRTLFKTRFLSIDEISKLRKLEEQNLTFSHGSEEDVKKEPVKRKDAKVGRNDLCPCGSGKKYKKCCGK